MEKRATIKDVARLAGVSISTASLAINGKEGVTDKTRKMVLDAVEELSYQPNNAARNLRTSGTKVIGLLIPDVRNCFYSEITEYIRREVESYGFFLILGITGNSSNNEKKYISEFISRKVDGVIWVPQLTYVNDIEHIKKLDEYGIPYLFLAAYYEQSSAPFVMCNLKKGSYLMTQYLIERDIHNIVMLIGDRRVDETYISGYKMALEEAGLVYSESNVYESTYHFDDVQKLAMEILKERPEAIMTNSDFTACAVLQAARIKGLSIPRDLSVCGYDDVIYATINQIPLTTVSQPIERMCKLAVNNLMNLLQYGIVPDSVILEPSLIIRDTVKR